MSNSEVTFIVHGYTQQSKICYLNNHIITSGNLELHINDSKGNIFSIKFNNKTSSISKNKLSAGAYYRQIKQCRKKYDQLIYTLVVFRLLNFIDDSTMETIQSIITQLQKISHNEINHNSTQIVPDDVIIVIEKIIRKINKI